MFIRRSLGRLFKCLSYCLFDRLSVYNTNFFKEVGGRLRFIVPKRIDREKANKTSKNPFIEGRRTGSYSHKNF